MNSTTDSTKSEKRKPRLRFSIRVLMVAVLLASVLLAWLAYHLRRLDQQDVAIGFLMEHNCQTFIGEFDDLNTIDFRVVWPFAIAPEDFGDASSKRLATTQEKMDRTDDQYYWLRIISSGTTASPPSGLLPQLLGPRLFKKQQIIWIGMEYDSEIDDLIDNMHKLPWLSCVVLEKYSAGSEHDQHGLIEVEQCALTEIQIKRLQSEFPNLQIEKSVFEIPPPKLAPARSFMQALRAAKFTQPNHSLAQAAILRPLSRLYGHCCIFG